MYKKLTIKRVTGGEDFSDLVDLHASVDSEFLAEMSPEEASDFHSNLLGSSGFSYLARLSGVPVGFISAKKTSKRECQVLAVYCSREYRGLRISSKLHDKLVKEAKEEGVKTLYCSVRQKNLKATLIVTCHWGYENAWEKSYLGPGPLVLKL